MPLRCKTNKKCFKNSYIVRVSLYMYLWPRLHINVSHNKLYKTFKNHQILRFLRRNNETQLPSSSHDGQWGICPPSMTRNRKQLTKVECGGAVVRAPALSSRDFEFDSHWISTLATLGNLLT